MCSLIFSGCSFYSYVAVSSNDSTVSFFCLAVCFSLGSILGMDLFSLFSRVVTGCFVALYYYPFLSLFGMLVDDFVLCPCGSIFEYIFCCTCHLLDPLVRVLYLVLTRFVRRVSIVYYYIRIVS